MACKLLCVCIFFSESLAFSIFSEGCVMLKVINHEPRLLGLKEVGLNFPVLVSEGCYFGFWIQFQCVGASPPSTYYQAILGTPTGHPKIHLSSDPVYLEIPQVKSSVPQDHPPLLLMPIANSGCTWASDRNVNVKVAQSCLTLCDPMDYIVHGILQARILEWVALPFSRGASQPRDQTQVFCIAGRVFTSWVTRESQKPGLLTDRL